MGIDVLLNVSSYSVRCYILFRFVLVILRRSLIKQRTRTALFSDIMMNYFIRQYNMQVCPDRQMFGVIDRMRLINNTHMPTHLSKLYLRMLNMCGVRHQL